MKKQVRFFTLLAIVSSAVIGGGFVPQSQAATEFRITIINHSNNVLTPTPFITHNSLFDLFTAGSAASSEIEALAEEGDPTGVLNLAAAGQSAGNVLDYGVVPSDGPILPGQSATIDLKGDSAYPILSYMSMLAFSNDAFIGGTTGDGAISLYSNGAPLFQNYVIMPLHVWDAGTEINDELASSVPALGGTGGTPQNGTVRRVFSFDGFTIYGHPGIMGIADVPVEMNWRCGPVAEISVAPVPVPGALWLLGSAFAGIVGIRRKMRP